MRALVAVAAAVIVAVAAAVASSVVGSSAATERGLGEQDLRTLIAARVRTAALGEGCDDNVCLTCKKGSKLRHKCGNGINDKAAGCSTFCSRLGWDTYDCTSCTYDEPQYQCHCTKADKTSSSTISCACIALHWGGGERKGTAFL